LIKQQTIIKKEPVFRPKKTDAKLIGKKMRDENNLVTRKFEFSETLRLLPIIRTFELSVDFLTKLFGKIHLTNIQSVNFWSDCKSLNVLLPGLLRLLLLLMAVVGISNFQRQQKKRNIGSKKCVLAKTSYTKKKKLLIRD